MSARLTGSRSSARETRNDSLAIGVRQCRFPLRARNLGPLRSAAAAVFSRGDYDGCVSGELMVMERGVGRWLMEMDAEAADGEVRLIRECSGEGSRY